MPVSAIEIEFTGASAVVFVTAISVLALYIREETSSRERKRKKKRRRRVWERDLQRKK
jgi:hypothetical protein